jgi:hypothetical protein
MYRNYVKRAVKNFTDLDVYQKLLEGSVLVAKVVVPAFWEKQTETKKDKTAELIIEKLTVHTLYLPELIAKAHSVRFGAGEQCLAFLEEAMLGCNLAVVYLEQTRDICETGLETEQFSEQIKKYFQVRQKVLNLQRVWKKFIEIKKQEQN